jgi:hypothetical protein
MMTYGAMRNKRAMNEFMAISGRDSRRLRGDSVRAAVRLRWRSASRVLV